VFLPDAFNEIAFFFGHNLDPAEDRLNGMSPSEFRGAVSQPRTRDGLLVVKYENRDLSPLGR
jgi:hypothetical protein